MSQTNKIANEIIRSLYLFKLRLNQEKTQRTEQEIWEDQMEIVNLCLSPVMKNLDETKVIYASEICVGDEWKIRSLTLTTDIEEAHTELALMNKICPESEFRIGRYCREMEI